MASRKRIPADIVIPSSINKVDEGRYETPLMGSAPGGANTAMASAGNYGHSVIEVVQQAIDNSVLTDTAGAAITVGGGGVTNLAYTAAVGNGLVTSDTGTDATLTPVDATNAGLMLPAHKVKVDFITVTQAVDLDAMETDVADLTTLSGVASNAQSLGTFTGTTIADSSTVKVALQALETSVETKQQAIRFEDEGVPIGSGAGYVDTINFVGSGITVTDDTGGNITVTVSGSTADTIGTHNGATFRYAILTGTPTVTYVTTTPTAPVLTVAGGTIKLKELWVPYSQGGSTDPIFLINGTVSADRAYSTPIVTKVIENSTTPSISGTYNQADIDNTPQVRYGDYTATSVQVQIAAVSGSWNFGFLFSMNQ